MATSLNLCKFGPESPIPGPRIKGDSFLWIRQFALQHGTNRVQLRARKDVWCPTYYKNLWKTATEHSFSELRFQYRKVVIRKY